MLGIIIPTVPGREDSLVRAMAAYWARSRDFPGGVHLHVETGHRTCGAAWDTGAETLPPSVTHLHFGADDIVPHDGWWQPLKEAADRGLCPTAIVLNPDGSLQSAGMTAGWPLLEIPPDWTTVEHTLTPFVTRRQWQQVRPIPHDLHYCTDWWVSARLQVPVVVRTGSRLTHHNHPAGRGAGMDENARNLHDRAIFARHLEETTCGS